MSHDSFIGCNSWAPELIVLVGLPGAGKSTWAAAWRAVDPRARVVVCRDEIRFGLFGRYRGLTDGQEAAVTEVESMLTDGALAAGWSVVVDATHLRQEYRMRWQQLAVRRGARCEVVALATPLAECVRRNRARGAAGGRVVPEVVIWWLGLLRVV